jgi:hypothetical protein
LEAVPGEKGGGIVFIVGWGVLLTSFIDVPGAFIPASVASPRGDITEKCLSHVSLVEGVSRISTEPVFAVPGDFYDLPVQKKK